MIEAEFRETSLQRLNDFVEVFAKGKRSLTANDFVQCPRIQAAFCG